MHSLTPPHTLSQCHEPGRQYEGKRAIEIIVAHYAEGWANKGWEEGQWGEENARDGWRVKRIRWA